MFVAWSPMRSKYLAIMMMSTASSPLPVLFVMEAMTSPRTSLNNASTISSSPRTLRASSRSRRTKASMLSVTILAVAWDMSIRRGRDMCALKFAKKTISADVGRLVPDAFHIGDHLDGRRDQAQVLCDGLLLKHQLQAFVFYFAFLHIDFVVFGNEFFGKRLVVRFKRPDDARYRLFAHGAHQNQVAVELFKLAVEFAAYHPNLPVI
jgi:hypothetical protein